MIHCQWMWKLRDIVATDKPYCAHLRLTMSYNYSWGCVALSNEKAPSRNYLFHCVSFLLAQQWVPTVLNGRCLSKKYKCVSWLPPRCWQIDRLSDEDQHLWNVCVQKAFIVGVSRFVSAWTGVCLKHRHGLTPKIHQVLYCDCVVFIKLSRD